jgi:hypothetical protein
LAGRDDDQQGPRVVFRRNAAARRHRSAACDLAALSAPVIADLQDDPETPPASGEPYWSLLGGRPGLEFAKTARERW